MSPEETVPRPRRSRAKSASTPGSSSAPGPSAAGPASPPPPPPSRPTGGAGKRDRKVKLEEFFGSLSLIPSVAGDEHCARILAERTPAMAEAWADLAKENRGVARVLDRLMEGSAWGGVILSTLAVALPIASHHGLYPGPDPFAFMYGPPTPRSRIIVPPPPGTASAAPAAPVPPTDGGGGADPDGPEAYGPFVPPNMTPPTAPDQPPGVVTVAGSTANHPQNGTSGS